MPDMTLPLDRKDMIFLGVILVLIALSAYFFQHNQNLEVKLKNLNAESQKTKVKIDELQAASESNQALMVQLEKDKRDLQESADSIKKQYDSVQTQIKKASDELKSVKEEKTYLEEMLINKTRELENKTKELSNLQKPLPVTTGPVSGTPEELAQQIRQKDRQIAALTDQNTMLSDKLNRIYKTTSAKIVEINLARAALEAALDSTGRVISTEWKTVDLGAIQVAGSRPRQTGSTVSVGFGAKTLSKSQGRIMVINKQHGFVIVNLGSKDKVEMNTRFGVLDEKNEVVMVLSVLEIQEAMTACRIQEVKVSRNLQVNDTVVILPKP